MSHLLIICHSAFNWKAVLLRYNIQCSLLMSVNYTVKLGFQFHWWNSKWWWLQFLENGQFTSTLASVMMLRLCMYMVCFVIEAVRRNPTTSKATNDQVEKEIKEWLKFAAERDGGRRQRSNNNRRQGRETRASDSSNEQSSDHDD